MSFIYEENQKIPFVPAVLVKINLASVIIGNGLTDAYTQFASIPTSSQRAQKQVLLPHWNLFPLLASVEKVHVTIGLERDFYLNLV